MQDVKKMGGFSRWQHQNVSYGKFTLFSLVKELLHEKNFSLEASAL